MGRLVGIVGGAMYVLRLVADLALIRRDLRRDAPPAESVGAPEVGRQAQAP